MEGLWMCLLVVVFFQGLIFFASTKVSAPAGTAKWARAHSAALQPDHERQWSQSWRFGRGTCCDPGSAHRSCQEKYMRSNLQGSMAMNLFELASHKDCILSRGNCFVFVSIQASFSWLEILLLASSLFVKIFGCLDFSLTDRHSPKNFLTRSGLGGHCVLECCICWLIIEALVLLDSQSLLALLEAFCLCQFRTSLHYLRHWLHMCHTWGLSCLHWNILFMLLVGLVALFQTLNCICVTWESTCFSWDIVFVLLVSFTCFTRGQNETYCHVETCFFRKLDANWKLWQCGLSQALFENFGKVLEVKSFEILTDPYLRHCFPGMGRSLYE